MRIAFKKMILGKLIMLHQFLVDEWIDSGDEKSLEIADELLKLMTKIKSLN